MCPLVLGSVFVLTGLVPIWLAARTFAKDRAIAGWPRVPGKVTKSYVTSRPGSSKDAQGYMQSYTLHEPAIEFTYTVGGHELDGNRLAREVIPSTSVPDMSRYPLGRDVMVYYHPSDPKMAYLEVHRSTGAVILSCLGGLFVFIGVLVPVLVLSCGAASP
jgi:uncharacterized protein DUF3592